MGKLIDLGSVIGFSWNYVWGTGTAREDTDEFISKVNQGIEENGLGYYSTYAITQAATYFVAGKALRKSNAKHDDLGGAGTRKDGDKAGGKGKDVRIISSIDDLSDVAKSKITTSQRLH